jgi:hypothetical protein
MRPPHSAPHILLLLLRMSSFIPSADLPLHSNYRLQGNGGYDLRRILLRLPTGKKKSGWSCPPFAIPISSCKFFFFTIHFVVVAVPS